MRRRRRLREIKEKSVTMKCYSFKCHRFACFPNVFALKGEKKRSECSKYPVVKKIHKTCNKFIKFLKIFEKQKHTTLRPSDDSLNDFSVCFNFNYNAETTEQQTFETKLGIQNTEQIITAFVFLPIYSFFILRIVSRSCKQERPFLSL